MEGSTMCYQRLSGNTNHNNVDQKPTHLPSGHYAHGHRWNEPFFDLTMPKNITSLVGKSAYLGCRVKHLGNKTVAWIRHRDLHILTVGTYTYTTDQRFQTSYHHILDNEQNDILLRFYNDDSYVVSNDRIYQSGDDEFVGMFGPLQTVAVPTATILGGPDLYVDKGSTINLTCVIKFSPEQPTHIFWYHQNKVLSEENSGGRLKFKTIKSEETKSILLIDGADLLDSGKFSCYPSNTEIASVRVHVLQGERPEAMQTNAAVAGKLQSLSDFAAITTIVGTFALLDVLGSFARNLNITIKSTTAKGITAIANRNRSVRFISQSSNGSTSTRTIQNLRNYCTDCICSTKSSFLLCQHLLKRQQQRQKQRQRNTVAVAMVNKISQNACQHCCNIAEQHSAVKR
uniref:Ig-like domain-containing protein n=1 Tax=Glossina brevipalpis TaxID=37001 RepID=A0A1A9WRG5_9MUSC